MFDGFLESRLLAKAYVIGTPKRFTFRVSFLPSRRSVMLSGKIISFPLRLEDKTTHESIKESKVYAYSNVDNTCLTITALMAEGTYQAKLDRKQQVASKRAKDMFDDDQWLAELVNIFVAPQSERHDDNLVVVGKLLTSSTNYVEGRLVDEDSPRSGGLIDEMVVSIKTSHQKLPLTVGAFLLRLMRDEAMEGPETDLLCWLDLLVSRDMANAIAIKDLQHQNAKLIRERDYYRKEVVRSAAEHAAIIKDIESHFYKVLNSKKDRIWELEQEAALGGYGGSAAGIDGLNEVYLSKNKFTLQRELLDLSAVPSEFRDELKKRKAPKAATKRSKKKEDGDDDEVTVKLEDATDGPGLSVVENERLQKQRQLRKFQARRFGKLQPADDVLAADDSSAPAASLSDETVAADAASDEDTEMSDASDEQQLPRAGPSSESEIADSLE